MYVKRQAQLLQWPHSPVRHNCVIMACEVIETTRNKKIFIFHFSVTYQSVVQTLLSAIICLCSEMFTVHGPGVHWRPHHSSTVQNKVARLCPARDQPVHKKANNQPARLKHPAFSTNVDGGWDRQARRHGNKFSSNVLLHNARTVTSRVGRRRFQLLSVT